jgi:type VI secretion system FHA domain protein
MPLCLEIISAQREELGQRARVVLDEADCTIGRALDNDWALPDQSRFLSGHHAHIHFRGGEYFLEDKSSNGTYVNDAVAPLGKRGTRVLLHAGDVLRMGEYRILVQIDELPPKMVTPDERTQADMPVESVKPLREARGRVQNGNGIDFSALVRTADAGAALNHHGTARRPRDGDLGDELDFDALLPEVSTLAGAKKLVPRPDGSTVAHTMTPDPGVNDSTMIKVAEQERLARLREAAKARLEGTGSMPGLAPRTAFAAFCRGTGIDPGGLPVQDETQALQLAGRLLRESLLGLKEILRAQQAFQNRNGLEVEAAEGRSPLDANMNEYLVELMTGHQRRKLDAVMQLRDQFRQAAQHSAAIDPALRGALEQFLAHLAPERLASGKDAAANWNRYKDVYGNLLQAGESRLPHLFLEALKQTYANARGKSQD